MESVSQNQSTPATAPAVSKSSSPSTSSDKEQTTTGGECSKVGPIAGVKLRPIIGGRQNLFGECLREMILQNKIEEPLVFKKIHQDWGPCKWTLGDWGDIFRDEKLSIRYGRQKWDHEYPQWESLCENLEITWTRLIEWIRGECKLPMSNSSPRDIWMYYDYKYLPEVIHLKSESEKDFLKLIYLSENLKKTFSWSALGFPDRNGDHSTLWIGTTGSYTNTHYDTYSCNLVCQVYGRKTWLVFPPCDTNHLLPSRIPYEESSVYSSLNLASEIQIKNNKEALQKCSPRRITLEPGDCLYLPPKWWHFVQSENFSISVNTWIELPSDHFTRVEEAILRTLVSSVVNSSIPSTADRILNPNEMDLAEVGDKESEETLHHAAKAYLEHLKQQEESKRDPSGSETNDEPSEKKLKLDPDNLTFDHLLTLIQPPVKVEKLRLFNMFLDNASKAEDEPSSSRGTTGNSDENVNSEISASVSNDSSDSPSSPPQSDSSNQNNCFASQKGSPNYVEHVLNAVGHPAVLKQIASQFLKSVTQRNASD